MKKILFTLATALAIGSPALMSITSCGNHDPIVVEGTIDDTNVTTKNFTKKFNRDGTIESFKITGFAYENMTAEQVSELKVKNTFDDNQGLEVTTTITDVSETNFTFNINVSVSGKSVLPERAVTSALSFYAANKVIFNSFTYKITLQPYGTIDDTQVKRTLTYGTKSEGNEHVYSEQKYIAKGFTFGGDDPDVQHIWLRWKHTSGDKIMPENIDGTIYSYSGQNFAIDFVFPKVTITTGIEYGYLEFWFDPDGDWETPDYYQFFSSYLYSFEKKQ